MREIETKIIDFDENEVRENLKKSEAKFLGTHSFKRYIFDLTRNKGEDEFLRVRTDGKETTMTYKYRRGSTIDNTEEIEVKVGDFDTTAKILSKVINQSLYQENSVEEWNYNNVIISISRWPQIPPVIEVEGETEEMVRKTIEQIGIKGKEMGNIGWESLYSYYGLDLKKISNTKSKNLG